MKTYLTLLLLLLGPVTQAQDFDLIIHAQGIEDIITFVERPELEKDRGKFTKESLKIGDLPEFKFTDLELQENKASSQDFFVSKFWMVTGTWENSEFIGAITYWLPGIFYIRFKMKSGLMITYICEITTFKYEDRR